LLVPGIICFRYVPRGALFDAFVVRLGGVVRELPGSAMALDSYWDYPNTRLERLNLSEVLQRCPFRSDVLALKSVQGILIDPTPKHLDIQYIVACHAILSVSLVDSHVSLKELLGRASFQLKEFTDTLVGKREEAPFRPAVWVLGSIGNFKGLEGTPREVPFPPFQKVYVERIFSSIGDYIIYGADLEHEELQKRIVDLALALLAPHILERGLRPRLLELLDEARDVVGKFPKQSELPSDASELDRIYRDRYADLMNLIQISREATIIQERVVRIGGMVKRIRQKHGSQPSSNIFDVICSDALTIVRTEADALIELVTGWNDSAKAAIDSIFARAAQVHNLTIEKVGWALQAVAAAFIVFQIADKILPAVEYRSATIVLLTGAAWIASYAYLSHSIRHKILRAIGDC